jgi:hypothetical protein
MDILIEKKLDLLLQYLYESIDAQYYIGFNRWLCRGNCNDDGVIYGDY